MSNLDSLLDSTLDDLADLPSYKPFPSGAHRCLASFAVKDISGRAAFELSFKLLETLEMANPDDEASKEGDEASTMFIMDNEFAQGEFKKCAAPFAETLGFSTNREIMEGVQGVECVIITSIRIDKKDPDKRYMKVKEISVV